ncbi:Hypp5844 [Branchiostoma lanceolatum]|uniref:Hypp5844 protein n=1 Tax=Branchiostoma lanceolatum TaxID=7740 RepID=A0A8J9W497_BRALA|nr:Hypp5844 [Branchiostoma lanceolatum]
MSGCQGRRTVRKRYDPPPNICLETSMKTAWHNGRHPRSPGPFRSTLHRSQNASDVTWSGRVLVNEDERQSVRPGNQRSRVRIP